ncbi:hypothetical protein CTheo_9071 [Ceratobasidium theobromae]|uniref:Uncharacterized protein n=1 Tax=Ceratobasidium theobromae TaxID=1582974 RepID=A0A5N5Q6H7_9AGAM|nr:hypothetical protein CTheo_9071 [Ceratobasidium theobromae]
MNSIATFAIIDCSERFKADLTLDHPASGFYRHPTDGLFFFVPSGGLERRRQYPDSFNGKPLLRWSHFLATTAGALKFMIQTLHQPEPATYWPEPSTEGTWFMDQEVEYEEVEIDKDCPVTCDTGENPDAPDPSEWVDPDSLWGQQPTNFGWGNV